MWTSTLTAQWCCAASWQPALQELHVHFGLGPYLLFIHRKTFPGIICKAHNLLSSAFQMWAQGSIPVSAGVLRISALPHSQWPMAITFLPIAKQSSATISARLHRPRRHPHRTLLELNIIWDEAVSTSMGGNKACPAHTCATTALCSELYIE